MKIINIIDSLELNGGSTMFLEMVGGMQRYWSDDEIMPYVVSKTGQLGRRGIVNSGMAASYDVPLQVYDYATFEGEIVPDLRDCVVFHHVLGHTKNIVFDSSCKYIVVNHVRTNLKRLPRFQADHIVCVSNFFSKNALSANKRNLEEMPPVSVILNGCEDYYDREPTVPSHKLVIGRCQRIVRSKFKDEKIRRSGVKQYLIGPFEEVMREWLPRGCKTFGAVFSRDKKIGIIKSFDIYLHSSPQPEGCSMAILEALSCGVPVIAKDVGGGTAEVIKHGVNGFFYKKGRELQRIVKKFATNPDFLKRMKKSAHDDFMSRFHVRHMLERYRKLI